MAVKADITIDIDKQVGNLQNLTNIYNARVGDNKTPLTVLWRKNGMALNLKGLHAFIAGKVGDGSYNAETDKVDFPVETPVVKYEDDGSGTLDNGQSGLTTLLIPKQMWAKTGLFAGYIGLKDENGSVFTSKDIFFKVLGNVLDAGVAINYFIGDFDKALAKAEKELEDKSANFDQTTTQALQDLHDKYLAKAQKAEDTLGDTQAAIDANIASLKTLAAQIASLQVKLQDEDINTIKQYENEKKVTENLVKAQIRNWNIPSQVFDDSNAIAAKYPNGGDYGRLMVITKNDGHRWIYDDNKMWADLGPYQGAEIAQGSITSDKISNYSLSENTIQLTPWTFDYQSKNLTVTLSSYFVKDNYLVFLPAGDYKMPSPANKTGDYYIWLVFDPDANTIFGTLQQHILPSQYYLGYMHCTDPTNIIISSPFKIVVPSQLPTNNVYVADYLKEYNVPQSRTSFFLTDDEIEVDFFRNKLIFFNSVSFHFKEGYYWISPQELDLNDIATSSKAAYIFGVFNEKDRSLKLVAKGGMNNTDTQDIPHSIYIGWVDFYTFRYSFGNIDNGSGSRAKRADILYNGKISVDFDKQVINIPYARLVYSNKLGHISTIPATVLPFNATEYDAKDDNVSGGAHLGLVINSDKTFRYVLTSGHDKELKASGYYLGWYLTDSRTYDFGQYGQVSDLATMPWINKKVTCLGDSITSGGGTADPTKAQSYVPELTNIIGTNATNAGVSGSLITSGIPNKPKSFAERVDTIQSQDVVTIFGGTNDFWFGAPLGKMGDTETNTFYGALEYVIKELMKNNPVAKFMLITPMKINPVGWDINTPTYKEDGSPNQNSAGFTELDYIEAIKNLGLKYSIPVLDMFAKSNYNPQLSEYVNPNSFSVEGVHPNIHGARRLAQTIGHAINSL